MQFDVGRPGKKGLKFSRCKNEGTYRSEEGEEEPTFFSDPGSELRLGREKEKEKCEDNNS